MNTINNNDSLDIKIQEQERRDDDVVATEDPFIKQIHRFKFSIGFVSELTRFSKLHQHDKRKDYKEAWVLWMKSNDTIVQDECNRLNMQGYYGDIHDKMYKSSRYYFRKKNSQKTEPRKRRKYISCEQDLLISMDNHISKNYNAPNFTPASSYNLFCESNKKGLTDEIKKMRDNGITDNDFISSKIKKTYKNRYFLFIKNNS